MSSLGRWGKACPDRGRGSVLDLRRPDGSELVKVIATRYATTDAEKWAASHDPFYPNAGGSGGEGAWNAHRAKDCVASSREGAPLIGQNRYGSANCDPYHRPFGDGISSRSGALYCVPRRKNQIHHIL